MPGRRRLYIYKTIKFGGFGGFCDKCIYCREKIFYVTASLRRAVSYYWNFSDHFSGSTQQSIGI